MGGLVAKLISKEDRILPKHIKLAVVNDVELDKLLDKATFSGSGGGRVKLESCEQDLRGYCDPQEKEEELRPKKSSKSKTSQKKEKGSSKQKKKSRDSVDDESSKSEVDVEKCGSSVVENCGYSIDVDDLLDEISDSEDLQLLEIDDASGDDNNNKVESYKFEDDNAIVKAYFPVF